LALLTVPFRNVANALAKGKSLSTKTIVTEGYNNLFLSDLKELGTFILPSPSIRGRPAI